MVKTVRTHGVLHGQDIVKDARAAKLAAEEIAGSPKSVSADGLADEAVRRALQRMLTSKRGISGFERFVHDLEVKGQTARAEATVRKLIEGVMWFQAVAAG